MLDELTQLMRENAKLIEERDKLRELMTNLHKRIKELELENTVLKESNAKSQPFMGMSY